VVDDLGFVQADDALGQRVISRRQLRPIPLLRSEWCG
jgi:hypothetical protein